MSAIKPQSASSGQSSPLIVVRTVHGDAISVRMELLGQTASARFSGDLPKGETSQAMRDAG